MIADLAPACSGYLVKIVGAGYAGTKAVDGLVDSGQVDAEFIAVDTDRQSLEQSKATVKVELNTRPTKGLCRGMPDPEVGREAAEDSRHRLFTVLHEADLVFVVAGMGGATGTGAAPVIARKARESGVPTVGVVSRPFSFQPRGVLEDAEEGINALRRCADALIIVPGDSVLPADQAMQMNILDACHLMDNALGLPVQCILDLVRVPSLIDYDLADLKCLFRSGRMGMAPIGTAVVGRASSEKGPAHAARMALSSPFLDKSTRDADAVLAVFRMAAETFRFPEMIEAADTIIRAARPGARVAYNARFEDRPAKEISVTAIWLYDTVL